LTNISTRRPIGERLCKRRISIFPVPIASGRGSPEEEGSKDEQQKLEEPGDRSEVGAEGTSQQYVLLSLRLGSTEVQEEERPGDTEVTDPRDAHPTSGSPLVGGRLLQFAEKWEILNPGPWVLETIKSGYRVEFTAEPPSHPLVKETPVPTDPEQREALEAEVADLLRKEAIQIVPDHEAQWLFHSSFFLTRKKGNLWRPILNLKPLNKGYIRPKTFRMETLAKIIPLLEKGCWAATIDLEDAYLHIPIHPDHRRFLAFRYKQVSYRFRALPFGLSTAPRVFTRVTRSILAFLRMKGITVFAYIDDWLIVADSELYH